MIKITALLVLVAGIVGFLLIKYMLFNQKRKRKSKEIESLITRGIVIKVPLNDCDIKSNQSYPDADPMPSQVEMVDALFGKEAKQPEASAAAYIIYKWQDSDGKNHRFISPPIFMSPESLRLRLDQQRDTNIHVDPSDINNYFFDIRFLQNGY